MKADLHEREPSMIENVAKIPYLAQLNDPARTETFVVHDGPPYANGPAHLGHFVNKVLKDITVRSRIQMGLKVAMVPGWDCHGLPIEIGAVKELKAGSRGMDQFVASEVRSAARRVATNAIAVQKASFVRWGLMADWEDQDRGTYRTMDRAYEAEQLAVFARLVEEGVVTRRRRPVAWSPGSLSALAESELEYVDDHVSVSVGVLFPVEGRPGVSLMAWTTTPWTLPANEALCVNPALDYVEIEVRGKLDGERVIVAEETVPFVRRRLLGPDSEEDAVKVVGRVRGEELLGLRVAHPLRVGSTVPVLSGPHVEASTGTGVVHTAPGHGEEDYFVGVAHGLPVTSPVDARGTFTAEAGPALVGLAVLKEGATAVVDMLRDGGRLAFAHTITHRYPYDWRSKTPVIMRATPQWFVTLDEVKGQALGALANVRIMPPSGRARLESFIDMRNEWCISRQRPWGVPLPVFYRRDTGEPLLDAAVVQHVRSKVAELGSDCWFTLPVDELLPAEHRGKVLPEDGGPLYLRGTDTLDVWFDSGCSWVAANPAGPLGSPRGAFRPLDVYIEGSDQHRGWFQSSLLLCAATTGSSPYQRLLTHGFVLDAKGRKMSKSDGNVMEPLAVVAKHGMGIDVLRLWVTSSDFTHDLVMGDEQLKKASEVLRRVRNTARFALGNLADLSPEAADRVERELFEGSVASLPELDRYTLHILEAFGRGVREAFADYAYNRAYTLVANFVHDLSVFYLDVSKDRLYCARPEDPSRLVCQGVLVQVLRALRVALAPIAAFTAHDIFAHTPPHLRGTAAQHSALEPFTAFPESWRDDAVAQRWAVFLELRSEVNKLAELWRARGLFGSSLETEVDLVVMLGTPVAQALAKIGLTGSLDHLFMTSGARVVMARNQADLAHIAETFAQHAAATEATVAGSQVLIKISRSKGVKCPRCWKLKALPGQQLCQRCHDVCNGKP